jgi:hypothetical protein
MMKQDEWCRSIVHRGARGVPACADLRRAPGVRAFPSDRQRHCASLFAGSHTEGTATVAHMYTVK